jgi:hypothetical protein
MDDVFWLTMVGFIRCEFLRAAGFADGLQSVDFAVGLEPCWNPSGWFVRNTDVRIYRNVN